MSDDTAVAAAPAASAASRSASRTCARVYAGVTALDGLSLTHRARRARRPARPLRLRQDHRAAAGRRASRRPTAAASCSAARTSPACGANRRNIGMVFQAYSLFPHMTAQQNVAFGLQLRKVGVDERRKRARRDARAGRPRPLTRTVRQPDVWRPAAAGRAGSGSRHPAEGAAARRAAVRARREGALAAPRRDPPRPARGRHHDAVRHARPGGGAGHRRPRRRDEQGAGSSSSGRRPRSTRARRRLSWPSSSA